MKEVDASSQRVHLHTWKDKRSWCRRYLLISTDSLFLLLQTLCRRTRWRAHLLLKQLRRCISKVRGDSERSSRIWTWAWHLSNASQSVFVGVRSPQVSVYDHSPGTSEHIQHFVLVTSLLQLRRRFISWRNNFSLFPCRVFGHAFITAIHALKVNRISSNLCFLRDKISG